MESDKPVIIATAPTESLADTIRAVLQDEDVPTYDIGGSGYGIYGAGSYVQIAVPPSEVERAQEILRAEGIDLEKEWAPNPRVFAELNRFWPRGKSAVRWIAWLWLATIAAAVAYFLAKHLVDLSR